MDILVRGHHLEVSDKFRELATGKLLGLEHFNPRMFSMHVDVTKDANGAAPIAVEITCRGGGPVVRAEARADDKFAAFDSALGVLTERLRRDHDRRRDHHRAPLSAVVDVLAAEAAEAARLAQAEADAAKGDAEAGEPQLIEVIGDGPLVLREKFHDAVPITLDDALHEMELVGHSFYLFVDKANDLPSVVYCRTGYSYGVIRLRTPVE